MLMNTFPSGELVFMQKPGGNGFVLSVCLCKHLGYHPSPPQSLFFS